MLSGLKTEKKLMKPVSSMKYGNNFDVIVFLSILPLLLDISDNFSIIIEECLIIKELLYFVDII